MLYWEAFEGKLGKVLGPPERAVGFFADTLNHEAVIAALDADGTLLGLAAFQVADEGFSNAGFFDLWKHYGVGACWRSVALELLGRNAPPNTLQMDGICVSSKARGQGVGSRLFDALFAHAKDTGHSQITLDVIDGNPRARALYERLGFQPKGTQSIGPLSWLFGFRSATKMVRPV